VLIILYAFYILIMKYNVKMQAFFTIKQKAVANGNTVNSELEDGNDYCDSSSDDPSMPLLGQGKAEQTGAAPTTSLKLLSPKSPAVPLLINPTNAAQALSYFTSVQL